MRTNAPRVLALLADRQGSILWRCVWPFEALQRQGVQALFTRHTDPRAHAIAEYSDAVILPRIYEQWWGYPRMMAFVGALRDAGVAVWGEYDDDFWSGAGLPQMRVLLAAAGKAPETAERQRQELLAQLTLLDGLTVSTDALAAVARQYTDKPVAVVPNAIDWDWWQGKLAEAPRTTTPLTIGWAGGRRLDTDLVPMAAAWGRIARRYPHVAFKVAGYLAERLIAAVPSVRLVTEPWRSLDTYPLSYAHVNIGCCPLANTAWNATKSACKAFEWAAVGAAVVASPTVYGDVLRDGQDGLIAETADDWEAALARLIEAADLRRQLAACWARRVRTRHSLSANIWRWPAAWRGLLADYQARAPRRLA